MILDSQADAIQLLTQLIGQGDSAPESLTDATMAVAQCMAQALSSKQTVETALAQSRAGLTSAAQATVQIEQQLEGFNQAPSTHTSGEQAVAARLATVPAAIGAAVTAGLELCANMPGLSSEARLLLLQAKGFLRDGVTVPEVMARAWKQLKEQIAGQGSCCERVLRQHRASRMNLNMISQAIEKDENAVHAGLNPLFGESKQ